MTSTNWPVLIHLWLQTAWRHRYIIALCLVLLPMLGLFAGVMKQDRYVSSTTILIQEAARFNPFLEDIAVETRLKDRISALEAMLHSRHILEAVALDLELITTETDTTERDRVVRDLSSALSLRLIGDEIIELSLQQPSPDGIDRTLTAVAIRFIDKVMAPEQSAIAGSVTFLEEQLALSAQEMAEADQALSDFQSQNAEHLPESHGSNVARLADLRFTLTERRTELTGANAHLESLIERLSQVNPVVSHIEQQIVQLTADLATLRSRYTDEHSQVQSVMRELERFEEERKVLLDQNNDMSRLEIERLWAAALQATEPDSGFQHLLISQMEALQEAGSRIADLERQVSALEAEETRMAEAVSGFGDMERTLRDLQRNADVKRELYGELMQRAEMARVTGALGKFEAPERVKVIDHPTIPSAPTGMPLAAFGIAGMFAALAGAVGIVALSEVLNTTIRRRQQIEGDLGLRVITRVPHLPHAGFDDRGLLSDNATRRRLHLLFWKKS